MSLANFIDHTLLRADATPAQIERLCEEAVEYGFHSVCVNPLFVPLAAKNLASSRVSVCSVIGFPLGASDTATKVAETRRAVEQGAAEIDVVIAVGMAKAGNWDYVKNDLVAVIEAAGGGTLVKVIIECCLLTDKEKTTACTDAMRAGADFVKTSTGFSTGGATVEDVRLMRWVVGENLGVKAAGGIKTYEDAARLIEAGASRLGTSNGIAIMEGFAAQ